MKSGDRVKITKPGHPAEGRAGVVLGPSELDDGTPIFYVATAGWADEIWPAATTDKAWPVFVLRPSGVELVMECEPEAGARLVEEIVEACEARGCPLRGLYEWAGPYIAPDRVDG